MKKNVTIKKNMILITLFIFVLSAPLSGCGQASVREPVRDLTPEEGYVIVTDYLGKQAKVKKNPTYIGSLFAVSTHIAAMYGAADRIVTMADGNTKDILFMEIYPQLKNARIVKGNNVLNIEEIVKEPRPEVLIANPEVTMDETTVKKLEKFGIPVITIAYETLEQQQEIMEMLGNILGTENEAREFNAYLQSVSDFIASRIKDIPESERKTVYHAINELLRTDIPNTLSADIISRSGVINIALSGEQKETSIISKNYIALEELLKHNPEYILINGEDVMDYINQNTRLHNLRAYREGHIYLLPLGVSRWAHPNSIEAPLAMLWIAKTVYPERFQDVDIEKETKDFYRKFFDYELSDSQLAKILSGRGYKLIKGSSEQSVN
jgi:iron complex transport system substrate-binding protein